jgi:hypothetical protein
MAVCSILTLIVFLNHAFNSGRTEMKRNVTPNSLSELVVIFFLLFAVLFFPSGSSGYVQGDVDGDGKISLTEAIHALQVVSEARSALSTKTINVPADIPTIQQAIDAASEGDTINIAAGTYNENWLYPDLPKALTS